MKIIQTLIILSNILLIVYSLIDIIRILNYIKKIQFFVFLIKKSKRIKKKNLGFFFKNLKKLFKHINLKTIYPIIFCLLFSDSLTICESENNIYHNYLINDKGELIEVNNEEEEIKEEKDYEEIDDFTYYTILTIIALIFFGSLIFILGDYFFGEGKGDDHKLGPLLTPYQKKWLGQENRLRTRICPHYIGRRNADCQDFDPEYVDYILKKYRDEYNRKHPQRWYITQYIIDLCYKIFKYY